jgi:hypothetical protein
LKNAGEIILIVGIVGIAVYLIYSLKKKSAPPAGGFLTNLDADAIAAANAITGFFGTYEFDSDTGDPNDPSNVFIPTM